jgi:hypothetical protein
MAETIPYDNSNGEADAQLFPLKPAHYGVGVLECNFGSHCRIQRAMDRDQVVRADELVKLDIMHMAALADLRCEEKSHDACRADVAGDGNVRARG